MEETKAQLLLSMEGEERQVMEFDFVNQYEVLADYDAIAKKILQKYKFVASGKANIQLSINNFYKHQIKVSIPIFHPKNWTTIIENMLERNITTFDISVAKVGPLRIKNQRAKKVPVEFDSDGSIESVQDDVVKTAITLNKPSCQPYRGDAVVRCFFCQHSSKSKQVLRSAGPFYGPFKGKIFAHLMCLLWCSQVYIDQAFKICGVEEGIQHSKYLSCSYCKKMGASFLCHAADQGCKKKSHFKCAIEKNWQFRWGTYQAYCPDEKKQPFSVSSASNTRTISNRRNPFLEIKREDNGQEK